MDATQADDRNGSGCDRRAALAAAGGLLMAGLVSPSGARAQESEGEGDMPKARLLDGKTLTEIVADYAAGTSIEKIPPLVRERAKKVIFDEMACGYFGRRSPGGAAVIGYVQSCGGQPEARIYGTELRAPAAFAAMANGTAGHGDEVDGTHSVGGHPGASIVHAMTALGEKQKISGAELINAVVLAYDVGVRLVEACGGKFQVRDNKSLTSDFFYSFGATSAAARMLRLSPALHRHALALATFQVNGLNALYAEKRHISKSFCNGQFAFAAISAAHMAQSGLEGNEDIIGSYQGVLDAWGDGKHDELVVAGLSSDFKILAGNFKFYNAGYPIHTPLEAALTLVKQNKIDPTMIRSIVIGMPLNAMKVVDNREMHNICVQDIVAANLVSGGLPLNAEPFPAILSNPLYKKLREAIQVAVDPDLQREFPNGRGARVTITTTAGRSFTLRIDNPRGHSKRGDVSWQDLGDKWRSSLRNCDPSRALDLAQQLESIEAGQLFAAFAGVNK